MHHFDTLLSRFSLKVEMSYQIYHQSACFRDIVFIFSLQFQIPSECMLQRHCFYLIICSSKSFQIPSECMLQRHCFHFFSAVSNRFKYHQSACFRDFVFKCSLQFKIVLDTVRIHALETLFSFFFSAVPNRFTYRQKACFKDIVFIFFSAVPNRFKYRQKACFRDIVFIFLDSSKAF